MFAPYQWQLLFNHINIYAITAFLQFFISNFVPEHNFRVRESHQRLQNRTHSIKIIRSKKVGHYFRRIFRRPKIFPFILFLFSLTKGSKNLMHFILLMFGVSENYKALFFLWKIFPIIKGMVIRSHNNHATISFSIFDIQFS